MPAGQYKVQLPWRLLQSQRALIVPVIEVRTWKAQHRGGVAACPQAGEHQGGRGGAAAGLGPGRGEPAVLVLMAGVGREKQGGHKRRPHSFAGRALAATVCPAPGARTLS